MRLKATLVVPMTALALSLSVASASPMSTAYAQQEQIYGSQLMTEQERNAFQAQMRAATSNDEREQIRWEHHIRMLERAKERGVTLPEEPMPRFGGFGPGAQGGQGLTMRLQDQDRIFGSQLMTEGERSEMRAMMRSAASDGEREQIRWEHHVRMLERAKERGVTLPNEPPMFGMHQGPGRGGGGQGRLRLPKGGGGGRGN